MSIVDDQIRRLDALLDKYQLAAATSRRDSIVVAEAEQTSTGAQEDPRSLKLTSVVRALSTTSSSRPQLNRKRLRGLLSQISKDGQEGVSAQQSTSGDESDLEWLATGKATVQVYGLILNTLLEQTIPLSESLWYWDNVLGSYTNIGLYTIQTAPARFWKQSKEVYSDAKQKFLANADIRDSAREASLSLSDSWKEFYSLVQKSVQERSLLHARAKILSPFSVCRIEARKKQNSVRRLREISATAIGMLVDEGLTFQPFEDDKPTRGTSSPLPEKEQWQSTVAKSVSLLENILRNAGTIENSFSEFEDSVFASVEGDPEFVSMSEASETTATPPKLANRLIRILDEHLPEQERCSTALSAEYGKPRRLVRYWIPGLVLLLSGSTLLRIFANRQAEIIEWIRDFGTTITDFWYNWVVEPTKKLVGTIRHDEQSEIAIQSKDSLKADRESLERMVIDYAVAHPENGTRYSEVEVADLRVKVREGDLTAVLKAYEREMQSPIKNAIMGDLIRTLLIQIQKTKVDVEVAIGGIDSLLKSQELLFGFVGIAPGVIISYAAVQWLRGVFGSRKGLRQTKGRGEAIRLLRNIDRTLNTSTPTDNGMLSYKDHGLLLCEVHVLRQRAAQLLPGNVQREFLEDVNDLMDIRIGVDRQVKVLDRIHWAYSKWLQ